MLHFHVYKLLYTEVEQCNSYYLFTSLFCVTSCSHYKNSVIVNSLVYVLLNVIVILDRIHTRPFDWLDALINHSKNKIKNREKKKKKNSLTIIEQLLPNYFSFLNKFPRVIHQKK